MARPSKFREEFTEQARKLALLGAIDDEIAGFFGVTDRTLRTWKLEHPEFREALARGKEESDARVEQSLYRRAIGYSHEAVKIFCDDPPAPTCPAESAPAPARRARRRITKVKYTEHYPPDTTACIFWLKNRKPNEWRDVKAVEHSGALTHRHVDDLTDDELTRIATRGSAGTTETPPGTGEPSPVH